MSYLNRINSLKRKVALLLDRDEISNYGARILNEDIDKLLDEYNVILTINKNLTDKVNKLN
jgi:hypothetical protein